MKHKATGKILSLALAAAFMLTQASS